MKKRIFLLVEKFEENGKPKDNRLVIWVLPYEIAKEYWEDRMNGVMIFDLLQKVTKWGEISQFLNKV